MFYTVLCTTISVGIAQTPAPQTTTPTVQTSVAIPENTPFKIEFQYDATPLPNFRWWCDGEVRKNFTSGEIAAGQAGTTFQAMVPGMLKKAVPYFCQVSAFTPEGEMKSDGIQVPIGYAPVPLAAPHSVKIVVNGK